MIGHQHETGAKNYYVEFFVWMIFFKVVEVHVFNFYIGIFFKQLLAGWNIIVINVNTKNFGFFETVNDTFQWMTSGGTDIKNLFDRLGRFFSSFTNGAISGFSKELRVDISVD